MIWVPSLSVPDVCFMADDMKLIYSVQQLSDCVSLQDDINRVYQWSTTKYRQPHSYISKNPSTCIKNSYI